MKDEHLITALRRALARYGTPKLPEDAGADEAHRTHRPVRLLEPRPRTPGWVSVGEIEAAQSPNAYPRLTRRDIKARCRELLAEHDAPVIAMRTLGLRTWVHVAPTPGPTPGPTPERIETLEIPIAVDDGGEVDVRPPTLGVGQDAPVDVTTGTAPVVSTADPLPLGPDVPTA